MEYDPSDSGSDDYDCSTAKKKKTNTSATQPSTLTQYKCPVCAKTLKTISGFRGHTQKQHGQNLRASDHSIPSTPDAEPVITSTSAISFADQSFDNATDINNFVYQIFSNIVSTSTDITLGTDREHLFRYLHKTRIRISQSIREEFASFFSQHSNTGYNTNTNIFISN